MISLRDPMLRSLVLATLLGMGTSCGGSSDSTTPGCSGPCPVGGACAVGADCPSGTCASEAGAGFPGGMCTYFCNASPSACPADAECLGDLCYPTCAADGECPAGYSCLDGLGAPRPVCFPDCVADAECGTVGTCNAFTGRCGPVGALAADGAACLVDADCESDWCVTDQPGGYCTSFCSIAGDTCAGDGACQGSVAGASLTGSCLDGCGGDPDCRDGYGCVGGVCVVRQLADGETACNADADCANGHCDLSSSPGSETGRCCASGDCCDADGDCGPWTCDSSPGVFSCRTTCAMNNDLLCAPSAHCDATVCVADHGNGAACELDADCTSGRCDGTCMDKLASGGTTCDESGDCAGNHCDLSASPGLETGRCCASGDCCDADADCGAGSFCRSSTATCVTGAMGSACDDGGDCDSGNCNTTTHLCQ